MMILFRIRFFYECNEIQGGKVFMIEGDNQGTLEEY